MNNCCQRYKVRTEEEKKKYLTHLNKIIGQLNGIKNMINEDRYCDEVITQLSASFASLKSLANKMLENHMHTCMVSDIKEGKEEAVDEVIELYRRFNK